MLQTQFKVILLFLIVNGWELIYITKWGLRIGLSGRIEIERILST